MPSSGQRNPLIHVGTLLAFLWGAQFQTSKGANAMTTTANELNLIRAIVDHDQYGERGNLDNRPWSWAVCDGSKSKGAVLGSLIKKGLAGQDGQGRDASCWLTQAGKDAYLANMVPASPHPVAIPLEPAPVPE